MDTLLFFALSIPCVSLAVSVPSPHVARKLLWVAGTSGIAGIAAYVLIPLFASMNLKSGLYGKDLGKKFTELRDRKVPEAVGIVSGIVWIVCMIGGELVFAESGSLLASYNAALLSVVFMVLLGFMDDVLDLAWRYKLLLPTIASLPLVVGYTCPAGECGDGPLLGATAVVIPWPLRLVLVREGTEELAPLGWVLDAVPGLTVDTKAHGSIVDIGRFFLVFISLLAVFCTNAINIYAGINGLEVGQAVVSAFFLLLTCLLEIDAGAGDVENSPHVFATTLIVPFLAVSLALWRYNRFPATVFVGDTFCYFAGMTFAVTGILGHMSKTLLLFFLPQIFNFLYSLPQLAKIVPCPRHRLPAVDPNSGLLVPSQWQKTGKDENGDTTVLAKGDNLTLICLVLRITGPISEEALTNILLYLQAAACLLGLLLRTHLIEILATVTQQTS